MNPNKLFLLSLTLLATISPALGMEKEVGNNEIITKPTFGRLMNKHVWGSLIALKRCIAQDFPGEIFFSILQEYLLNPNRIVLSPLLNPKTGQQLTQGCIFEGLINQHFRANIALEFLADPAYADIHQALMRLIVNSDFSTEVYTISKEHNYDSEVQKIIKNAYSKEVLTTFMGKVFDIASLIKCSQKCFDSRSIYFEGTMINRLLMLLTHEDALTLIHCLFNCNPKNMQPIQIRAAAYIILLAHKLSINLNFENIDGLTPLMWTLMITQESNGLAQFMQEIMLLSEANLNYTNKHGQTFESLAPVEVVQHLKDQLQVWKSNPPSKDMLLHGFSISNPRFYDEIQLQNRNNK